MAQHQAKPALDTVDPVWARIRREAEEIVRREPELATFIDSDRPAPRHARNGRGRAPAGRRASAPSPPSRRN